MYINAFSILFSDAFSNEQISEISKYRNLASLPFGGRYRLIDFILSSLVKAEVPNVGIITRNNYSSLVDHLGSGKDWDLDRKHGGLKILTPFADNNGQSSRNKFEALNSIKNYIRQSLQDYCILADSNMICNIDFRDLLKKHIDSSADVTMLYKKAPIKALETEIFLGESCSISDMLYHSDEDKKEGNVLLKVYILKKDFLLSLIDKGITFGWVDIFKDFVAKNLEEYKFFAYEHTSYLATIRTTQEYFKANMDLLTPEIRKELFQSGTNILTKIKDSVPTMYGENSNVTHSLIADGCKIDGTIENCIIFRDVKVEKGAVIKNSIIMQGSYISENSMISNIISDKNIRVSENKVLSGSESLPFVISKGMHI
jgi:glucose-1-phosphate adenylyltransferase